MSFQLATQECFYLKRMTTEFFRYGKVKFFSAYCYYVHENHCVHTAARTPAVTASLCYWTKLFLGRVCVIGTLSNSSLVHRQSLSVTSTLLHPNEAASRSADTAPEHTPFCSTPPAGEGRAAARPPKLPLVGKTVSLFKLSEGLPDALQSTTEAPPPPQSPSAARARPPPFCAEPRRPRRQYGGGGGARGRRRSGAMGGARPSGAQGEAGAAGPALLGSCCQHRTAACPRHSQTPEQPNCTSRQERDRRWQLAPPAIPEKIPGTFWENAAASTYCFYPEVAIDWNFLRQAFWIILQPFEAAVFLSRGSFRADHAFCSEQQVSTNVCHQAHPVPGLYNPRLPCETGKLTGNWGLRNFPCETCSLETQQFLGSLQGNLLLWTTRAYLVCSWSTQLHWIQSPSE